MTRILLVTDNDDWLALEVTDPAQVVLESVADGTWLPPEPYRRLVGPEARRHLQALRSGDLVIISPVARSPEAAPSGMTLRQRQMLQLLAMGMDNRQISRHLGISYRTVVYHMGSLKQFLGVRSRKGILVAAARRGLIPHGKPGQTARQD